MTDASGGAKRRDVLKGMAAVAATGAAATTVPWVPKRVYAQTAKTLRIGVPTILSGRVAILGQSSQNALMIGVDKVNAAGGIGGRKLELVIRDSRGAPDQAAKTTRDLINTEGCEVIIDAEASSGAFAVQEVIRELGVVCVHTCSETSALTADPKLHVPTAFRAARQGIHDAVSGGQYAADIAKAKNLKKWVTCSPDYAYGRDNTAEFLLYAKKFYPAMEVSDQIWPKLFAPDYTEAITRILQIQPQAMYSALWGGDMVTFVEQANLYNLFGSLTAVCANLGDPPIVNAVKSVPQGVHTSCRYNELYPANPGNKAFADEYKKRFNQEPTNWSWENAVGFDFVAEGLRRTNGATEPKKLAGELKGMKINSPWGVDGTITMRAEDHTIINYPAAWGITIPKAPFVGNWKEGSWATILDLEKEWKKEKGYI